MIHGVLTSLLLIIPTKQYSIEVDFVVALVELIKGLLYDFPNGKMNHPISEYHIQFPDA